MTRRRNLVETEGVKTCTSVGLLGTFTQTFISFSVGHEFHS